ncbi:MAG TPA: hypothetical protein VFA09_01250 [Ktedonobacteraceae bacterium]|nr:hypothetical protein [Ktedonobacteraceae bacterium]
MQYQQDEEESLAGEPCSARVEPAQGMPLQYDPWSALLHSQGIEVVDLGQIRSHMVQEPGDILDVEQALDIMQERPESES